MKHLWILALLSATAFAQHSVQLLGCSSPTLGVQYNFYKGLSAGNEAPAALNTTPVPTCNYTDTSVIGLQTYFYYAKAVCATCTTPLSAPSNEVKVTIPGDPQPAAPVGLTAGTIANNTVPLFWNAPAKQNGYDVLAYEVFRGTSPSLPTPRRLAILPASTLKFSDPGCGKSKAVCYYKIEAYSLFSDNSFMVSAGSNIVKVTMP